MATSLGLTKQKVLDIKDTNMAFYGSDDHKKLRKMAASTEVNWKGAGTKVTPGLEIWRVENNQGGKCPFGIRRWPEAKYGQFFDGDSYICLKTYKKGSSKKLYHDIYFWLGAESSIDEKGVAAYKTVELDEFLDYNARQHRVCMGSEPEKFADLFKAAIVIMHGGVDSGFKHVVTNAAKSGKGTKNILRKIRKISSRKYKIEVMPLAESSLDEEDVFILDAFKTVYQYNGEKSSPHEKNRAKEEIAKLKKKRHKNGGTVVKHVHVHRGDKSKFWTILGSAAAPLVASNVTAKAAAPPTPPVEQDEDDDEDGDLVAEEESVKSTVLLDDSFGGVTDEKVRVSLIKLVDDMPVFETVQEGDFEAFDYSILKSDGFYVVDSAQVNGDTVWCWSGSKSDKTVRTEAMMMIANYLGQTKYKNCPVTLLKEGDDDLPKEFKKVFHTFGKAFDNSNADYGN